MTNSHTTYTFYSKVANVFKNFRFHVDRGVKMVIAAFLFEDVAYAFSQKFKALRKEMKAPDVDFVACYGPFWALQDLAKSIDPQLLEHPLVKRPYEDCDERINYLLKKEMGDDALNEKVEQAMEGKT